MRGYSMDKQAYLDRLHKIEGQVRGLQRTVDQEAYCIDVLTQISAATRALQCDSGQSLSVRSSVCLP